MHARPLVLAILLSVGVPAAAQGTLVVSQNKCDGARETEFRRMTDSLFIPVAQELVNEGKLIAVGSAYHLWGDEWNVVIWYTATTPSAFLAAWSELVSRMNQRHPEMFTQFQAWCKEHKDSMYSRGRMTVPSPTPSGSSSR